MTDKIQDELLSAYLDDELSADERARVEQELASSAELRQLLEELRSLRTSFDALPRHQLGDDFARQVLRRAEVEMLSGKAETAPAIDVVRDSRPATAGGSLGRWLTRNTRALSWAGTAIAAALLLMLYNPQHAVNERVAPAEDRAFPTGGAIGAAAPARETDGLVATSEEPARTGLDSGLTSPATSAPLSATAATAAAGSSAAADAATSAAPGAPALDDIVMGKGAGGRPAELNETPADKTRGSLDGSLSFATNNQLLIVYCSVTPQGLKQRAFDQVLANGQIDMEEKKDLDPVDSPKSPMVAKGGYLKDQEAMAKVARDRADNNAVAGVLDTVLVETTTDQMNGVLSELNKRPEWFASVEVEPAPGEAAQQPMTSFNRGATQDFKSERISGKMAAKAAPNFGPRGEADNRSSNDNRQEPSQAKGGAAGQAANASQDNNQLNDNNRAARGRAQRVALPEEPAKEKTDNNRAAQSSLPADELRRNAPQIQQQMRSQNNQQAAGEGQIQALFVIRPAEAPADEHPPSK